MKEDRMRKKLIVSSLLLFTTLSFSYDFESLEVPYSEKKFNEKGCGAIITLLEKKMTKKLKDADEYDEEEVALFLTNIASDVADGDKEAVADALSEAEFDKEEIALILKQLPEAPPPIDPYLIANLGKLDVDKLLEDYLKTGKLAPKYEKYRASLNKIVKLLDERKSLDDKIKSQNDKIKDLDRKLEENKKTLASYKEIEKKIAYIKSIMSEIPPAK